MKKLIKLVGIIAVVFVALIIIVAVSTGGESSNDATTKDTAQKTPVKEQKKKEKEPEKEVGIGQELQVGDVFFTANKVDTASNVGGEYGVNAQSQFTIIEVTVRNEKDEAITVDSNFFTLLANDKKYKSDSSAGIYANEQTDFFLTSLNPDVSITGKVVFDVPADLQDMKLQVQTGFFGTETGIIDLK